MKTKKNLFSERDCLLVLGEGNFSFTAFLSETFKCRIIATDVTNNCTKDSLTQQNCDRVIRLGHKVVFGIDATKLDEYTELKIHQDINYIIFNFPHVLSKKMKIGLNRDLLKRFFESSSHLIGDKNGVKLMVSLCGGQSGINAVDKQREWSDSWQLPEMAANGQFVIIGFNDFCFDYQLFGYRLKGISFNASDAKTFILEKRKTIDISSDKLSQILLNNRTNLFSKDLVLVLIEDIEHLTNQLTTLVTQIDYQTDSFPFVKHWLRISKEANTLFSLSQYLGHVIDEEEVNLIVNNTMIGYVERSNINLCVENLTFLKYNINDSRIVWSEYLKFDDEEKQYMTGSLFYRQHIHDISFWVNSNSYYKQLLETILDVFGTLLKSIELIDSFVSNEKTSKCYRIVYESVDRGFSQKKCNQMQKMVRDLLTQRYGLTLR